MTQTMHLPHDYVVALSKTPTRNKDGLHPHRTGFCDGIFGRACLSPWANDGWRTRTKNTNYLNGYIQGQEARRKSEAKQ